MTFSGKQELDKTAMSIYTSHTPDVKIQSYSQKKKTPIAHFIAMGVFYLISSTISSPQFFV